MKPNWYTLAAFGAVCAAIAGAHALHQTTAEGALMTVALALATALMPAMFQKPQGPPDPPKEG